MARTDYSYQPYNGYRSDIRLVATSCYGTYPGKGQAAKRPFGAPNSTNGTPITGNGDAYPPPLLHSTTNAFETDWQPPTNPALLPPLHQQQSSSRRNMNALRNGNGITLKGSPSLCGSVTRPPNLFDCPAAASSSTLALGGGAMDGSALSRYGGGENATCGGRGQKRQSRQQSLSSSNDQHQHNHRHHHQRSASLQPSTDTTAFRRTCRVAAEVTRTVALELLVGAMATFLHIHVELLLRESAAQLLAIPLALTESVAHNFYALCRVGTFALIDGVAALILFAAFPTLHLNPLITIAHMFSSLIPSYICVALLFAQFVACALNGIVLYFYLPHNRVMAAEASSLIPTIGAGGGAGNYVQEAYQTVLNQFIGTALVVICHIEMSQLYWAPAATAAANCPPSGRPSMSPDVRRRVWTAGALFAAVWLSSFLSLLRSNVSWNPVFGVAVLLHQLFVDLFNGLGFWANPMLWRNYYVLWMGPVLGALFGCFLHRLAFTGRKIYHLVGHRPPHHNSDNNKC